MPGTETGDAQPTVTADGRVIPNFDAGDRDYMIRTIAFESAGEPEQGKVAVAHVILNRIKHGGWGDTIKDVLTSPWQFEPWMTKREEIEKLSANDPSYKDAAQSVDAVLAGGAGSYCGCDVLSQSYSGSGEARRLPTFMGAGRRTANWQPYLLPA